VLYSQHVKYHPIQNAVTLENYSPSMLINAASILISDSNVQ